MIDNAFSFFEYSSLYVGEITLWIAEPRLATSQSTSKQQDTAMDNYHEENCTFTFDNDNRKYIIIWNSPYAGKERC